MRSPPSGLSLVTAMPFFFNDPAIAPRTLWDCQPRDLPSCAIVAPAGWRSIVSSRASLVLLGFVDFLGTALAAPVPVFLVIVHSSRCIRRPVAGAVAIA